MNAKQSSLVIAVGLVATAVVVGQQGRLPLGQRLPTQSMVRLGQVRQLPAINLRQQGALTAFTLLEQQMFGAGDRRIVLLEEGGTPGRSFPTTIQRPSISPHNANQLLVGDLGARTISTFDVKTGKLSPLLNLREVRDQGPPSPPTIDQLQAGEFSSVASDGKNVYVAVEAGFSSAIFKIDPASKRIVAKTWASAEDPEAMTFHDGSLYVLVGQGREVRRFSESLVKSHDLISLPTSGKGLGVTGSEVRTLANNQTRVARYTIGGQLLSRTTLRANLDLRRPVRLSPKLRIKLPAGLLRKRYAVLICGDLAENFSGECFWNDTVWMFKTLLANGYQPADIFVLYGDGVDYASANPAYQHPSTVTDFAATTSQVNLVLDGLKNGDAANAIPKMDSNDTLFVWTFDHGASSGGVAYLCLRDAWMSASSFSTKLNAIPYEQRAIFMQQCYSGGFINSLKNNKTFISTACRSDEVARPADTENEMVGGKTYSHGEFNYHVTTALNRLKTSPPGGAVNADGNSDTFVSSGEMHAWNVSHESRPETPQVNDMGGIGNVFRFKK
ncbi:MAG: hypothetical protein M9921_11345 [Fimbriimonadaceae bacterium]|nr:hypothetical protein [Chthonomonadaceae bacterium]MCO5297441.1 hypothetical protein [Fimbriimonadaceae bacterium]